MAVGGGRVGGREGLGDRLVVAVLLLALDVVGQRGAEGGLGVGDLDPVLRALRAGDRGDDGREVELQLLAVARLGVRVVPEALLLGVGLDQRELLVARLELTMAASRDQELADLLASSRARLVAIVDEIAGAADLVMGKATGVPVAVVRGLDPSAFGEGAERSGVVSDIVRSPAEDLFR